CGPGREASASSSARTATAGTGSGSRRAAEARRGYSTAMTAHAETLRSAALPRRGVLTELLLVLAGTGLIAAAAQISIPLPFTPVPITGQTFAVLLVGASLGAASGMAST